MNALTDPKTFSAEIERIATQLSRFEGRRETLGERVAGLERDVSLARGRLALKKDVETFIQEMQAEAYERTTHTFETMLSALVSDVLPESKPIALALRTERGLPALDITVRGKGGINEDIFEDHGGALNNVMSMGLRLIAVIKSGGTRFLALDEPECWVKPDRVPDFFRVLKQSALKLETQTLAITHHDAAANFDSAVRISRLVGHPETGATIESDTAPHTWQDGEKGFRFIRMKNFQGFVDTTMHLSPRVNALTGPNDHGKSSVIRAFRAVFYGELRDSLIRHGAKETIVEVGLEGGRILRLSRAARRNPKNIWSLLDADGKVVVEDGERYETPGNNPPEWVDRLYGIVKHDGLDIHLAHQKHPVFLLDKPASKRASVLSIGQESGYTTDMLAIHKENCARDNETVRDGEREIGELRTTLEHLKKVDAVAEQLKDAREIADIAMQWAEYVVYVVALGDRLERTREALAGLYRRRDLYAGLPDDATVEHLRETISQASHREAAARRLHEAKMALDRARATAKALSTLPDMAPDLSTIEKQGQVATHLADLGRKLEVARKRADVLDGLPAEMPVLAEIEGIDLPARIGALRDRLAAAHQKRAAVEAEAEDLKQHIQDIVDAEGGHCPTCGQAASADTIIANDHEHAA